MLNDLGTFKKIKEGDIAAFEKVFRCYYAPLHLYSFSITGRRDISEEIIQDLFYTIWKDRENLNIISSIKNYLYGAVRNRSLQYIEHRNVQERHKESALYEDDGYYPTPHEQLEYKELEGVIDRTLKQLPDRRLKMFRMHRMEGMKYKEIADYFSVSVKTVEAEMTKAYQILRQEIERYTHVL